VNGTDPDAIVNRANGMLSWTPTNYTTATSSTPGMCDLSLFFEPVTNTRCTVPEGAGPHLVLYRDEQRAFRAIAAL